MLRAALTARLGDDVMREDPTVLEFEQSMAELLGKEEGLFLPTATMSNLVAILAHCNTRACEIIVGHKSHIHLWEGGNVSNIGGIHTRQVRENDSDGQFLEQDVLDCLRDETDDHQPCTALLCLENTHNMGGGIALSKSYMDRMSILAHDTLRVPVHVDGSRIFNAAVALYHDNDEGRSTNHPIDTVKALCEHVDSVTICLSKGLGAPVGSILVGNSELIRLARRARKRCGGGMRQAGVIAAMGYYAVQYNVERLIEDHVRAQKLSRALQEHDFLLLRNGQVDTNIVYFGLPDSCTISNQQEFIHRLAADFGVKVTGGYTASIGSGSGGKLLFRAVTHMDVDDAMIDRAIEGMITLGNS